MQEIVWLKRAALCLAVLPLVIAVDAVAAPPQKASPRDYILYVQHGDGSVVFTRHLSAAECEFALNRAKGLPALSAEKAVAAKAAAERKEAAARRAVNDETYCRAHPGNQGTGSTETDGLLCFPDGSVGGRISGSVTYGTSVLTGSSSRIAHVECFRSPDIAAGK